MKGSRAWLWLFIMGGMPLIVHAQTEPHLTPALDYVVPLVPASSTNALGNPCDHESTGTLEVGAQSIALVYCESGNQVQVAFQPQPADHARVEWVRPYERVQLGDTFYDVLDARVERIVLVKHDFMPGARKAPPMGNPAPALRAVAQDGTAVSLAALQGQYVLLDFWGSWCGPCRVERPVLETAAQRFADSLIIVGIAKDDTAAVRDFVASRPVHWPQIVQAEGDSLLEAYYVRAFPTRFLIDPQGRLLSSNQRRLSGDHLIETLGWVID